MTLKTNLPITFILTIIAILLLASCGGQDPLPTRAVVAGLNKSSPSDSESSEEEEETAVSEEEEQQEEDPTPTPTTPAPTRTPAGTNTPGPSPTTTDTPPIPTITVAPTQTPTSAPQVAPELTITAAPPFLEGIPTPPTAVPTAVPTFEVPKDTTNILLLGSDTPLGDGATRTDTMIIVAVNRSSGTASLISLPRDLYVYHPGKTMSRLNTAFAFGGVEQFKTNNSLQLWCAYPLLCASRF